MSLVSTYSGASIRGWESISGSLWVKLQTLNAPANITGLNFGEFTAITNSGNIVFSSKLAPNISNGQGIFAYFSTGINWASPVILFMDTFSNGISNPNEISTSGTGDEVFIAADNSSVGNLLNSGRVYRFTKNGNTYNQTQLLLSNVPVAGGLFGAGIGCSNDGNYISITCANVGNGSSGIFVFSKSGNSYIQQQLITVANTNVSGEIAMNSDGNYFVVTAAGAGNLAIVFNKVGNSYVQQQQLLPSVGNFGILPSVDINGIGNIIILGTPTTQNGVTNNKGSAYIFKRSGNTWTQSQIIYPAVQGNNDGFGRSVSINNAGDQLMISSHGSNTSSGETYIYNELPSGSYYESVKITNPNPQNSSFFGLGLSMAKEANIAIIPAYGYDISPNTNVGIAYIYGS